MWGFIKGILEPKPKEIPSTHKECPVCEGTGDYDPFIDCLTCDGQGHMHINVYYDKLANGEFRHDY